MRDHPESVNLWALINTLASKKGSSHQADCEAIQDACCGTIRFATELSLTVHPNGDWVIEAFDHQEPFNSVTLTITPIGRVSVERRRSRDNIVDTHTISF